MLRLTLVLWVALAAATTSAATDEHPIFELMPTARYLVDVERHLSAAAVHALADDALRGNKGDELNLGIPPGRLWVRLRIPQKVSTLEDCVVVIPSPIIDHITLHYQFGQHTQTLAGGDNTPYSARAAQHRFNVFPLPQCQPEAALLLQIDSASAVRLRVRLMDAQTLSAIDASDGLALGIFYGLMLALFLYNLMLVFADYDRGRIYYLAYLICATAIAAILDGMPGRYPPFEWWPQFANEGALTLAHGLLFCGVNFARAFLHTSRTAPGSDRLLRLTSWLIAGNLAIALLIGGVAAQRLMQGAVLTTVLVLAVSIISGAIKGHRQARVMLVVFSGLALPAVLWSAQTQGLIAFDFLADSMLQLGIGLEALLLSFALADRIRFLNQQQFEFEHKRALDRQTFLQRLIDSREQQQREFARELHDAVGQNVLALKTRLDRWARDSDENTRQRYLETSALAGEIVATARELAHRLHPSVLERLGLSEALGSLSTVLENSNIDVTLALDPAINALRTSRAAHVYRIFQEAISNVVRHANARTVTLRASRDGRRITIELCDDGVGLDDATPGGLGLTAMRERADIIGATLEIISEAKRGTTIALRLDLDQAARHADVP